jgi:hypothetical protein
MRRLLEGVGPGANKDGLEGRNFGREEEELEQVGGARADLL